MKIKFSKRGLICKDYPLWGYAKHSFNIVFLTPICGIIIYW
jgi:hypothetical protein